MCGCAFVPMEKCRREEGRGVKGSFYHGKQGGGCDPDQRYC